MAEYYRENCEDYSKPIAMVMTGPHSWTGLNLGHNFHETKQGVRYTISEPASREVLDRLLALNHERYAEEVKAGLHDKGAKKGKRGKSKSTGSKPAELPFDEE